VAAPVILPIPAGATQAFVNAINGTGSAVGYVEGAVALPVRWVLSGGVWTVEVLPDLGQGGRASGVNDAGFIVGSVVNKNGTSRPVFWTPGGSIRMLGTGSRGEGSALGVSEGTSGLVIGGMLVTGKSATDLLAVRWRP
jgi:hypothetical protein